MNLAFGFLVATVSGRACRLFNIRCDVNSGFLVSIDQSCKSAHYNHLPSDNEGIFVYASNLDINADPDFDTMNSSCSFNCWLRTAIWYLKLINFII